MAGLSAAKKADRMEMAAIVKALAESLGATVEVKPEDPAHPYRARRTDITIRVPGGAYLPVDFDGDSGQHREGVFVCTWNTELDSLFAFAGGFGSVNEFHFSKATRVAYGFDDLCEILRRDIPRLVSGEAYSAERATKLARDRRDRLERAREHYAPLVAAGLGTTNVDGTVQIDTPEQVRDRFDRIPALLVQLDSFIAAGCPMQLCGAHPYR